VLVMCEGGEADSADVLSLLASCLCAGQQLPSPVGRLHQTN